MVADFWRAPRPRVFSAPSGSAFLPALARGVTALAAAAPEGEAAALADGLVMLPTRRAARALAHTVLAEAQAVGGANATLLPRIIALADIEADAAALGPAAARAEALWTTPPALSAHQRRFDLAALLHAKARARDPSADPAASLPLADALARLLDDAAEAQGDLRAAGRLYDALPAHLQDAAAFVEIVADAWPRHLAQQGRLDRAERQARILRAAAAAWREDPPAGFVIAAGSTGSMGPTAALLAAVASAPRGCVVLPGLDVDADARAWAAVDEQHPQAGMKHLLAALAVERTEVRVWPASQGADADPSAQARRRLIAEALRPAHATADWRARLDAAGRDGVVRGLAGLAVIEAPDEDREARAVALAARHQLETPGAEVMVVTPDAGVSTRIAVALRRWGIRADVSAGQPLAATPVGGLLAAALALAADPGDPVAIAAVTKHPLALLRRSADERAGAVTGLERVGLRGVRAGADLAALARRLERASARAWATARADRATTRAFLADLQRAVAPLVDDAATPRPVTAWAERHGQVVEALAEGPPRSGEAAGAAVWGAPGGAQAAELVRALMTDAGALAPVDLAGYGRMFTHTAAGVAVRAEAAGDARVRILGPLEARLLHADLVVLAGLNEGVWPAATPIDPLFSRGMRAAAGLAPAERDLGRAAHDFEQLAAAPRVLLTRAQRVEGAPAVASRWLWRLETLCRGVGVELADVASPHAVFGADYLAIAEALDHAPPEAVTAAPAPAPRPPVSARPRRLSVTDVGRWIRDPYWVFARRVLALEPLEPLDRLADVRERGVAIHDALHDVLAAQGDGAIDDGGALERALATRILARLAEAGVAADALARERARAARAAAWFAAWECARRDAGWRPIALEAAGARTFDAPGGPFTLTARADRLDQGPDAAAVIDYKTGQPPTDAQVAHGLEPQLALEAAILAEGGFDDAPAAAADALIYVRWRGGRDAGDARTLFAAGRGEPRDASARAARTRAAVDANWAGLMDLVALFDDPATPYLSHVRDHRLGTPGEFDRLARRKEWSSAAPAEAQ